MRIVDFSSSFAKKYMIRGVLPYLWLAFLSAFLSVPAIYGLYNGIFNEIFIQKCGVAAMLIVAAFAIWLGILKKLSTKKLIFLAIAGGFIIRTAYVAYTAVVVRQHDTDVYYSYDVLSNGHYGYMLTIYNTGRLPLTNGCQFYHPPLMHLLGAAVIKFGDFIDAPVVVRTEMIQVLTLFFSSATMVVMIKIIGRLKLSEPMKTAASLLAAFQPHGIILSGSINNDCLMWLFFCTAILYLLKWNEKPAMLNIIMLAFSLGLGMMTKMSCALLIPVITVVFILKFVKNYKTLSKTLYKQFVVFLLISVPIAMWFPIRNYILFSQPLNYVYKVPEDSPVYTGNVSVWHRFAIDFSELFSHLFVYGGDKNVWCYMVKTASFDELQCDSTPLQAVAVVAINVFFTFVTPVAMLYVIRKERKFDYCILGCIWLILLLSLVKFSIDFPYLFTPNFRYIFPTAMIGAVFMARSCELLAEKQKWVKYVFLGISAIFVACVSVSFLSEFCLFDWDMKMIREYVGI